MTTLLRDVIPIPEQVYQGDFVLKLTEGVEKVEQTLGTYVVTPQLTTAFDDALGFVKGAVDASQSKATYLHGSFGSGKSHFMAVLHLLLQHNPQARSVPELAQVVAKHDHWVEGRKFLLVPFHMIGAKSMESAILGRYAEYVRQLHPEAPVPGVFLAEKLFADAEGLRQSLGDEAFLAKINQGRGDSAWGALDEGWTAESYAQALQAPPRSETRSRLVGDLLESYFSSYGDVAASGDREAFLPLDDGLSVLSRHASDLGYDAVVLFLDELILWLASHSAEPAFVSREGQKLAKLVEAEITDRPAPLISFVARQRDLKELVGEHVTGAEELSFADVLSWWEARFHKITLEDRNLPAIASRRILKPGSDDARGELDRCFEETTRVRPEVLETLLGKEGDREMFRQLYPFSPALVQALVAISGVLQRERTALKVMLQLLVDQRDTLELGQLVPVGDLFDVIARGDEPFTEGMRVHFRNARRLWEEKLLPLLEEEHGQRWEVVRARAEDDSLRQAFSNDGRLIKTLLLAALVPEIEAFKGMTAGRLATLNHGTMRAPIPGREAQMVLGKLRKWAARVGQVRLSDDTANPTVQVQLSGVDTEAIVEKARIQDNAGERMRKIREILYGELGIRSREDLFERHEISWKGHSHAFQLIFGNVRELPDESLKPAGPDWRVVLDFPFDREGHTPQDDLARIESFRHGSGAASTLIWLPSFLSRKTQKDLGDLVVLDHLLTGERFDGYASHLSAVDRQTARALLDNRRSQLREQIRMSLEMAYGVAPAAPGVVDESHGLADHFQSLDPTFQPRPPVGANLRQAFESLLGQVLDHRYPAHPDFGREVKIGDLRKAHEVLQEAVAEPDGRILVERPLRPILRDLAQPLKLGTMHETHFVLSAHWRSHFDRRIAGRASGATNAGDGDGASLTVGKLRSWIDQPEPMGLPTPAANLVLLVFAEETNRSFYLHGGPVPATLDRLADELELREQELPAVDVWEEAVARAERDFGLASSKLLNAINVADLAEKVQQQARDFREPVNRLRAALLKQAESFEIADDAPRLQSLARATTLIEILIGGSTPARVIVVLAEADLGEVPEAVVKTMSRAAALERSMAGIKWELFESVRQLPAERGDEGRALVEELRAVLAIDEQATALAPKLEALEQRALELLTAGPPKIEKRKVVAKPGWTFEEMANLSPREARDKLASIEQQSREGEEVRVDLVVRTRKTS